MHRPPLHGRGGAWCSTPTGAPRADSTGRRNTSSEFATWCRNNDVQRSLGRTGVCWDNAVAESFFAALKNECYHLTAHPTKARARFAVADYIEVFYNRQRLHTALGYRTPAEALEDHRRRTAAA